MSTVPSSSNGAYPTPTNRSGLSGNKKKQKRKGKRQASDTFPAQPMVNPQSAERLPPQPHHPSAQHFAAQSIDDFDDSSLAAHDAYDEPQDDYYSDENDDDGLLAYNGAAQGMNGAYPDPSYPAISKSKKKKKKARAGSAMRDPMDDDAYKYIDHALSQMPRKPLSASAFRHKQRVEGKDRIWNTSTQEERERIKEFWLSLSEKDRRDLLKIEKEAVLRKMKEQQKHSCSCTVCGRKRTAIEEELEVLYDAYYEELEQYANQHPGGEPRPPRTLPRMRPLPASSLRRYGPMAPKMPGMEQQQPLPQTSRVQEVVDDGDPEYSDEEGQVVGTHAEQDRYSDEDDDMYTSSEESDRLAEPGLPAGFFDFGNSLTVKGRTFLTDMLTKWQARLNSAPGGILTVADDLLKNDGKKFIEMMEQLAERRMQREQDAEYMAQQPSHTHANGPPPLEEEGYEDDGYDDSQDEEEEDDEDDEDEDDYEYEEEDDMVCGARVCSM